MELFSKINIREQKVYFERAYQFSQNSNVIYLEVLLFILYVVFNSLRPHGLQQAVFHYFLEFSQIHIC